MLMFKVESARDEPMINLTLYSTLGTTKIFLKSNVMLITTLDQLV